MNQTGDQWLAGMTWTVLAGAMQGAFPIPLKFARAWKWENIWLASSLLGLVVFPWFIAYQTIPQLPKVLSAIPLHSLERVCIFGTGWGIGGLLFGQAVHRVGITLATGIVLGLTSAIGSLAPMALLHPNILLQRPGFILLAALAIALAGIYFCAVAGAERERRAGKAEFRHGSYLAGAIICILSGILSPLFNFALIYGEDLISAATARGARAVDAPNLIWAVAMTGGFVPTLLYCGYLMGQSKTWRLFGNWFAIDAPLALIMGLLFAYGNAFYGRGAEQLGKLGAFLGWPVFMSMQVITGSALGAITGEWRGAGPSAVRWLMAGLILLVVSIFLVGLVET